jgi:hypothetical protein
MISRKDLSRQAIIEKRPFPVYANTGDGLLLFPDFGHGIKGNKK